MRDGGPVRLQKRAVWIKGRWHGKEITKEQ